MNSFQGSERLIFEYIQHHACNISNISAKEIARDTFTTTTSVNRVCKKMGYKSGRDADLVVMVDCQIPSDDLIVHFF